VILITSTFREMKRRNGYGGTLTQGRVGKVESRSPISIRVCGDSPRTAGCNIDRDNFIYLEEVQDGNREETL